MAFMAMGTDTGGSIRIPAAFCGTVGLKPTYGRVSRFGVLPLDFSLDHMGPLTRSVREAALVLNAIAGYDQRDDTSSRRAVENYDPGPEASMRGLRIGVPEADFFEGLQPAVEQAVRSALRQAESLGARLIPVRLPELSAMNAVARVILLAEASALMEPYFDRRSEMGSDVIALFDQGRFLAATDYVNAQRLRRIYQSEVRKLWRYADVLMTPTASITAARIGENTVAINGNPEDVRLASTRLVRSINLLGLPALSIPCGRDERGLPIGLQIIGPAFGEARILQAGQAMLPGETPIAAL
jgi:aspartyl-tRNA(Asn)/glutamyl-tRNA(Gln) amidotransferase subunit A